MAHFGEADMYKGVQQPALEATAVVPPPPSARPSKIFPELFWVAMRETRGEDEREIMGP